MDAIQEAIDELDPEAVAARKAKEAAAAAIARKLDLTWKEDDEKWDDSKGRLGHAATRGIFSRPCSGACGSSWKREWARAA